MNEARLSHLPFWGPGKVVFILMKRPSSWPEWNVHRGWPRGLPEPLTQNLNVSFGLTRRTFNQKEKSPHWDPKTASGLHALRSFRYTIYTCVCVRVGTLPQCAACVRGGAEKNIHMYMHTECRSLRQRRRGQQTVQSSTPPIRTTRTKKWSVSPTCAPSCSRISG